MANPAPTINQINAFNATQGTTIDFNIIGGTELVRSNRIYIYDLSDNSLICTHLYASTESIHELPPNTDGSIVYESGKSSADFVNGAQYYAQIQTFTDIGGTEGGSGLSVAKMFWCLVDPSLTISTIPSSISTTSYNVSATYNANTSVVSNIIQQYQFNLYNAIGSLLQSSGVVVGSGEQQGTSTAYDISYNFTGLSVGSSYYVTVEVTTTQGMSITTQSNTFTISIDTPTLGEATVVNNACDGYISVTSNLSSEYEHEESVGSGEIMSFTTDSVNDITELDVDFSPVQDGTPWMSTQNTEPYTFRAVPTQTEDFGYESDTIVGGTVAWNQLVLDANRNFTSETADTRPFTLQLRMFASPYTTAFVSNLGLGKGVYTRLFVGIDTQGSGLYLTHNGSNINIEIWRNYNQQLVVGHKYLFSVNVVNNDTTTVGGLVLEDMMLIDLTAMFGSTIADYVYSLEQATAGSGIAWLKSYGFFTKPYYEYDTGTLKSVNPTAHVTRGINAWDEEWGNGYINTSSGELIPSSKYIYSKNLIPIVSGANYYIKTPSVVSIHKYDASGNYIGSVPYTWGNEVINGDYYLSGAAYIRFNSSGIGAITTYNNDICINISDPTINGKYFPYEEHTYDLGNVPLYGLFQLVDNKLKAYGDVRHAVGGTDRKFMLVDLGTFPWTYNSTTQVFYVNIPSMKRPSELICEKYVQNFETQIENAPDKSIWNKGYAYAPNNLCIKDSTYTDAATFKTAMSGVYLVYELATPTTESADPYTNPQIVDPSGTEEYVGSPIPVGHKTTYQRICPISGWDSVSVDVVGVNIFDGTLEQGTFTNQGAESAAGSRIRTKYVLVDGGDVSISTPTSNVYIHEVYCYDANNAFISRLSSGIGASSGTVTVPSGAKYIRFSLRHPDNSTITPSEEIKVQVELSATPTPYTPYQGTTHTIPLGQTVYGGTLDAVSGVITVKYVSINPTSVYNVYYHNASGLYYVLVKNNLDSKNDNTGFLASNMFIHNNGVAIGNCYITATGTYLIAVLGDQTITTKAQADDWFANNNVQFVYELATPIEISLTPQQIQTLSGQNNIWSNTNGGMSLVYQLPITSLLVKRRDVADVSGKWLTLYSVPITQASDMDFTFIDFLNQYGKKYQYALVPVLAQNQSGVVVQIEGGYTVSDNVDSIFDGVYIADQTNVERVKAGVGYGNIDMNQGVGSITPIGSKYPIVITNSQNQYHNGSIRGTIVPNDFYSNGNLSRIDMVNKRDELEQFLTNKRAKIIKDWNGKMWLVMIMSNVACSFDDNYGMGIVSFSADWLEVGDPTNQQDLYNAGLINVGGV